MVEGEPGKAEVNVESFGCAFVCPERMSSSISMGRKKIRRRVGLGNMGNKEGPDQKLEEEFGWSSA